MATDRTRTTQRVFAIAALGAIGVLAWTERRAALRRRTVPTKPRVETNVALAGLTAVAAQAAMTPIVAPLCAWTTRRRVGLVQWLDAPDWLRDTLALLALDYTLYLWHVAEHRVALLYRFHQVHHADLDMDVSTAARFHFGEFVLSVPWRAAQIVTIGVSERALRNWQRLTMLSMLFHHSNVRLPIWIERRLGAFIMTPRLHGIHHSIVADEQNSNWSSGLTIWDRLHGTLRDDVPQENVVIGVPALRDPSDVTLAKSLTMPVKPLPPWRLPDGREPT